jgi:hypothetical protein
VLAALEDPKSGLSPTLRRRLDAARDYLAVAPAVVRVVTELALPTVDDRLPRAPADFEALAELATRWGLGGSVQRVVAALAA